MVDMHHKIPRREVGIGLELLAARVLLLPRGTLPAGCRRGKLPLCQYRKLQLRPLAAGRQRTKADDDLARSGQHPVFKVRICADCVLFQKTRHISAACLIAAKHQHAAAGAQILFHIRRGCLQASAVGRQRAHMDGQQRTRRGEIARGGQTVKHDERILPKLLHQSVNGKRKLRKIAAEHALFDQRFRILILRPEKVFRAL